MLEMPGNKVCPQCGNKMVAFGFGSRPIFECEICGLRIRFKPKKQNLMDPTGQ